MVSYYRAFAPKSEAVKYMDYRATLSPEGPQLVPSSLYSKVFVVKYSYPQPPKISYIAHNNYLTVHEQSVKNDSLWL